MNIREKRQEEFADIYLQRLDGLGILNLCPRFGKIRTTIKILEKGFKKDCKILICYPNDKIKQSWIDEFKLVGYKNKNVTYTTYLSLKKYIYKFDLVVFDECHAMSEAQLAIGESVIKVNDNVLGLTGTLSAKSENDLANISLSVIGQYSIDLAIREGVVTDYLIHIVKVPLDNKVMQVYKSGKSTEKGKFDSYTYVINKMVKAKSDPFYIRLARMRVIQGSIAKINKTKELLKKFKDERVLVFCGNTLSADSLGCKSYHYKTSEKNIFQDFIDGNIDHMAVCKIGGAGVTYPALNKIIVNYFSSNEEDLVQKLMRCMAIEWKNPKKIADIYLITSDEEAELKWLESAISSLDQNKIIHE